jgi:hypothetical protein
MSRNDKLQEVKQHCTDQHNTETVLEHELQAGMGVCHAVQHVLL